MVRSFESQIVSACERTGTEDALVGLGQTGKSGHVTVQVPSLGCSRRSLPFWLLATSQRRDSSDGLPTQVTANSSCSPANQLVSARRSNECHARMWVRLPGSD